MLWFAAVRFLNQFEGTSRLAEKLWADITVRSILAAAIATVVLYGLLQAIDASINRLSEQVPPQFRMLIKQSLPFWRGFVLVVGIIYIANLFLDLSPSEILAITGTAAVTLGFAFKDYVSSIMAGIVALYEAPYRVGDRIKIGENYGEVVEYRLRSIQIRAADDSLITIPHSRIWTEAVASINSGALEAQVITDFYLAHDVDVTLVKRILYQTACTSKYTQLAFPIQVSLEEQPWCTHFQLKAYPMDVRDEFIYKTDLTQRAKQSFARYHLTYPESPSKLSL